MESVSIARGEVGMQRSSERLKNWSGLNPQLRISEINRFQVSGVRCQQKLVENLGIQELKDLKIQEITD
jgi:hypothetical protein